MTELTINAGSFLGFSANRSADEAAGDSRSNRMNICVDRRIFLNGVRLGLSEEELVRLGMLAVVRSSDAAESGIDRVADFAFAPHTEVLLLFDRGEATGHEFVLQVFGGASVTQYWWTGATRYYRKLVFSDSGRKVLSSNGGWKLDGAGGLSFDAGTRVLGLRDGNGASLPNASVTLPLATASDAGLMSGADKKRLDMAALMRAGGVFDSMELAVDGAAAIVPEFSSTPTVGGKVVFSDNVKPTAASSLVTSAFLYKVDGKYYYSAPSGVAMPSKNGLNVCRLTSGGYYVDGDGALQQVIPAATEDVPGLMSPALVSAVGDHGERLQVVEEDFVELSNQVTAHAAGIEELLQMDTEIVKMVTLADGKTRACSLGSFDTEKDGYDAAAQASVAGNPLYRLLWFSVGNEVQYIEQAVYEHWTLQYLSRGRLRKSRYIRFTDTDRKQVAEVQATWQNDLPRNLQYTQSSRVLQLKDMWGNGVGGTVTLPLATASVPGLLSVADKTKLDACVTSDATTTARGLMSEADKKKLDDCVTTDATTTARGLMTPDQVIDLMSALARYEVGYFSAAEHFDEGTNAVLQRENTAATNGTVVFCNRIGNTEGATITSAGFVYKVGKNYYQAAPGAFKPAMPSNNGIAINITDGCAYVVGADGELHKFIPAATASAAGLMSAGDKLSLGAVAKGLYVYPTLMAGEDALDAAAGQAAHCADRSIRFFCGRYGTGEGAATTVVYLNSHSGNVVTQYKVAGDAVKRRSLVFDDVSLGSLVTTGSWKTLNPSVWV